MTINTIWSNSLKQVNNEFPEEQVSRWMPLASLQSSNDNNLYIIAPNKYSLSWIKTNVAPLVQKEASKYGYYYVWKDIVIHIDRDIDEKVSLNFKSSSTYQASLKIEDCLETTTFEAFRMCQKSNQQVALDSQGWLQLPAESYLQVYRVLQKSDMLTIIFSQADFAYYDEELAAKKDTTIEEVDTSNY